MLTLGFAALYSILSPVLLAGFTSLAVFPLARRLTESEITAARALLGIGFVYHSETVY